MPPFFSIILPTYNRGYLISDSIISVVNQTYENWELIIVDDGSTDNTKEVVEETRGGDTRIKYIYQENKERSAARNNGITHAIGKYICFIDSDDLYLEDNLRNWYKSLTEGDFPVGMFYCNHIIISMDGVETKVVQGPQLSNTYAFLFLNPIVPSRVCLSQEITKKFLFEEDISVGEDVTLWLKVATKYTVTGVDHFGSKYILHEDNTTNIQNASAIKMYHSLSRFFKRNTEIKNSIPPAEYNGYFSEIIMNIAKYYFFKNKTLKSGVYLIKALLRSPIHKHTKYRLHLLFLTMLSNKRDIYE